MNKNKNFRTASIVLSSIFTIAGFFLILNPQISQQAIGTVIGVIFIIYGISKLSGYIFGAGLKSESFFDFISGLLNIGIGMFVIYHHGKVLSAAAVIIGITICFESIMKIITSFELKKSGYENWKTEFGTGLAAIIISLLIIFNPFKAAMAVYVTFGIALVVSGIFHFWTSLRIIKIMEILEPVETTATVYDDNPELPFSDDKNEKK